MKNYLGKSWLLVYPRLSLKKNQTCDACQLYKKTRQSFNVKDNVSISKTFQIHHMGLFGPTTIASIGGERYAFRIIDDFSRFTWIMFLTHKNDALSNFEVFYRKVQREEGYFISTVYNDHEGEFKNSTSEHFFA